MLQEIDRHLISRYNKGRQGRIGSFIASKPGFILTTALVLYRTLEEVEDMWQEAHYLRFGIFTCIAVLLTFFSLRHIIWNKQIEHFEYRLKLVEAAVFLYTGVEIWHHKALEHGYSSLPAVMLAITTPGVLLLYLMQARLFYLKKKELIVPRANPRLHAPSRPAKKTN